LFLSSPEVPRGSTSFSTTSCVPFVPSCSFSLLLSPEADSISSVKASSFPFPPFNFPLSSTFISAGMSSIMENWFISRVPLASGLSLGASRITFIHTLN
ncbi:unnamed protein product, partial [Linum tenue]